MSRSPRTTINLEMDERKKLAALAAVNERSIAAEARLAIKAWIELHRTKSGRRS